MIDRIVGRQRIVALVLGVLVLAALGVAHVWSHLQVIDYGYRLSRVQRLREQLQQRQQRLRAELALLKRPSRITALASREHDMHARTPLQMRQLHRPRPLILEELAQTPAVPDATQRRSRLHRIKTAGFGAGL